MILVTGGAGYIGSHCVLNLLKNNFDVVIFDNLELGHQKTIDILMSQKFKGQIIDFIKGDLKNFDDINGVFKKHKIEAVVHFAAYSQVAESIQNPIKYYKNNVDGSKNLFKAMIDHNVYKIVFSSTAAVYGEPIYTPIDEDHPMNPINPYGESKLRVENILDELDAIYGLKSIRLRYFNVAGADSNNILGEMHDIETHLIPNIIKSALSKNPIEFQLFGDDYDTIDGTCIRDYINVEDLAEAHKLALHNLLHIGETNVYNLGTNSGNSVKEIFGLCERILGQQIFLKIMPRREGDPAILVANNQKILKELNWKPQKTIQDSINTALQWEKSNKTKVIN